MQHPVILHNDSIATAYRYWSPSYNIHFGYWRWGASPFNREAMLEALNEVVFQSLTLPTTAPVRLLDAGCGTGATLRHLSKRLPQAELQGISLAPGLIELGKELNQHAQEFGRISLQKGDFQNMPFPSASFDALIAIESVCYGTGADKAIAAREFSRVLRQNGKLIVVDVFLKSARQLPWPFQHLLDLIADNWAIEEMGVLPATLNALKANGFHNIRVRNISWNSIPCALHIPWVIARLLGSALLRSERKKQGKLRYAKALATTLLTGMLAPFLGYYLIVATKAASGGDK